PTGPVSETGRASAIDVAPAIDATRAQVTAHVRRIISSRVPSPGGQSLAPFDARPRPPVPGACWTNVGLLLQHLRRDRVPLVMDPYLRLLTAAGDRRLALVVDPGEPALERALRLDKGLDGPALQLRARLVRSRAVRGTHAEHQVGADEVHRATRGELPGAPARGGAGVADVDENLASGIERDASVDG